MIKGKTFEGLKTFFDKFVNDDEYRNKHYNRAITHNSKLSNPFSDVALSTAIESGFFPGVASDSRGNAIDDSLSWFRPHTHDCFIVSEIFREDPYGLSGQTCDYMSALTRYKFENDSAAPDRLTEVAGAPGADLGLAFQNELTIVDIGAHIGSYSMLASIKFPDAKVYSFEAFADNYQLLDINTSRFDNITATNAIIRGDRMPSEFSFCQKSHGTNTGGIQVAWADSEAAQNSSLPSLTLGEIFEKNNISTIDILKMDCEGSEYAILELAKKENLLERVNCITMELHVSPEKDRHFHDIFKYLDSFRNIWVTKIQKGKESRMIYAYRDVELFDRMRKPF